MGKVVISIKHVAMREQPDGTYRPRFVPGASLRKLGYKGRDLKTEAGQWFNVEQARDFARKISEEIEARRKAKASGKRLPRPAAPAFLILSTLFDEFEEAAHMQPERAGRAGVKRLAPATVRFYKQNRAVLTAFDAEIMTAPVAAIRKSTLIGLFEKLAEAKGIHTARAVIATLSAVFSHAERRERIAVNPATRLKLAPAPARIRVGSLEEMRALIQAADLTGRHEIGDAIMLGLFTGQRQADRLALIDGRLVEGRLYFRQDKTGAVVMLPPAQQLIARLESMRERRRATRVNWPHVVIDETAGRPFKREWFSKCFASVRAAAVAGIEGKLAPTPSLADFRDQDLRDTAVTWLANAGCTIPEICAITGHSEQSATQILKHYLGRHPEQADNAIGKLVKYLDGKGGI